MCTMRNLGRTLKLHDPIESLVGTGSLDMARLLAFVANALAAGFGRTVTRDMAYFST
jgi:hypothetical protein